MGRYRLVSVFWQGHDTGDNQAVMMAFFGSCGMRTMLGTYLPIEGDVRLVRHNGTANAAQADRSRMSAHSLSDEPRRHPDDRGSAHGHMVPRGYADISIYGYGRVRGLGDVS